MADGPTPRETAQGEEPFVGQAMEATIRIGLVAALVAWCFTIVRPFIVPVAWATIIAVAVHPVHLRLRKALGGRSKLSAAILTLLGIALLVIPAWLLAGTVVEGAHGLAAGFKGGKLVIPAPPPSVAEWPIVGPAIADFWTGASQNLAQTLGRFEKQLMAFGAWLLSSAAGAGFAVLLSLVSLVIAGILLVNDQAGERAARVIGQRLAGERGVEFANLAGATVRSVAQGILGVALIQALLAALGFVAMGIPGAGLWALIGLLLCVVQIGLFPILIPILIYVFNTSEMLPAVLFTGYCGLVGLIDNVLKPLLLGRGVKVPTVVIFLGAIGGFLSSGIIGLFVGSVVLVLGYTLLLAWLGVGAGAVSEEAEAG